MQYKVVWPNGASLRTGPSTGYANVRNSDGTAKVFTFATIVNVLEDDIPDSASPTTSSKRWVRTADGYVASDYPDGLLIPRVRMELVSPLPDPNPATSDYDVRVTIVDSVVKVLVNDVEYKP